MENNNVVDSVEAEPQVEATESATTTDTDVWSEDFDVTAETTETDTAEEESSETIDFDTAYKSQLEEGGKLDKPIFIKYKGKVVDVSDVNEIRDMMERATAATFKLQEAAELRKQYEGITPDDIELLKRFKEGDTSVIEDLATKRESFETSEIDTIASEILAAPYAEQFKGFVNVLPAGDKSKLSNDPRLLAGLKKDFDDGLAQKLMPLVERKIAVNGLDFLSAYIEAGKEVMGKNKVRSESLEQLGAVPKATTSVKDAPTADVWSMDSDTFRKLSDNIRK